MKSVLRQHRNEESAKETVVHMIYSKSLSDAVANLSPTINKLLLPMFKKNLLDSTEYNRLRGIYYPGEKIEMLYEILLKKGGKGLNAFVNLLKGE